MFSTFFLYLQLNVCFKFNPSPICVSLKSDLLYLGMCSFMRVNSMNCLFSSFSEIERRKKEKTNGFYLANNQKYFFCLTICICQNSSDLIIIIYYNALFFIPFSWLADVVFCSSFVCTIFFLSFCLFLRLCGDIFHMYFYFNFMFCAISLLPCYLIIYQ